MKTFVSLMILIASNSALASTFTFDCSNSSVPKTTNSFIAHGEINVAEDNTVQGTFEVQEPISIQMPLDIATKETYSIHGKLGVMPMGALYQTPIYFLELDGQYSNGFQSFHVYVELNAPDKATSIMKSTTSQMKSSCTTKNLYIGQNHGVVFP